MEVFEDVSVVGFALGFGNYQVEAGEAVFLGILGGAFGSGWAESALC